MLIQYLNSNETLRINDSFKLYLTIFSVNHENFKKTSTKRQRKRTSTHYRTKKFHVGKNSKNLFKQSWSIDFPTSFSKSKEPNIFLNKCLLLCFIVGLLQHSYFENKRENKLFVYVQNIKSKDERKITHAGNILVQELHKLYNKTKIKNTGPYELTETVKILSNSYRAQFFIFTGLAFRKKLCFMYPSKYDDSLKPIFLYQDYKHPDHLVFIKNLNAFFRANYKICFACKKSFSSINYYHLCALKESCFACRRFYESNLTYMNDFLRDYFCDSKIGIKNPIVCSICNITCYNEHCLRGHRRICYGKGHLGWKCLNCNRFFYRYGKQTSLDIKKNHNCSAAKRCRFCFQEIEPNHLCLLRKVQIPKFWPKIGFLSIEFIPFKEQEPLISIFYIEKNGKEGMFEKIVLSDTAYSCDTCETVILSNTLPNNSKIDSTNERRRVQKADFKKNVNALRATQKNFCLTQKILQILLQSSNTTFLCQDENTYIMVLAILFVLKFL